MGFNFRVRMKKEEKERFEIESLEKEMTEEIGKEKSLIRKFFFILMALAILLLMVSFVFVSYPVGDILASRSESSLIEGNRINLGDFSIILENGTYEMLEQMYFNDRTKEISLCMIGNKEYTNYYITSMYQPETYSDSYSHVSFEPCSEDTIIMLHTHPYKRCIASQTDIETLDKTKQRNADVLMVVMCEAKRFSVYG